MRNTIRLHAARDYRRSDAQPQPLAHSAEARRHTVRRWIHGLAARAPRDVFACARDLALEVDAPRVGVRVERDGVERQLELRRPAMWVTSSLHLPEAAPIVIEAADVLERAIPAHAVG